MRVVLADDSVLLREGLARLLTEAGFEVTGQRRSLLELELPPTCKRRQCHAARAGDMVRAAATGSYGAPGHRYGLPRHRRNALPHPGHKPATAWECTAPPDRPQRPPGPAATPDRPARRGRADSPSRVATSAATGDLGAGRPRTRPGWNVEQVHRTDGRPAPEVQRPGHPAPSTPPTSALPRRSLTAANCTCCQMRAGSRYGRKVRHTHRAGRPPLALPPHPYLSSPERRTCPVRVFGLSEGRTACTT